MNYLGHLYFSQNDVELMQANLYGDFFKGKDLSSLPEKIQQGVRLHRQIDDYIDHHPVVLELLRELYPKLPKVSGIAIDLMFDHLLAKNWNSHHSEDYTVFIHQFYQSVEEITYQYDAKFMLMLSKMKEIDWLSYYPRLEGLEKSSAGVGSRITFTNNLHEAPAVFLAHESQITTVFEQFMQDAKKIFG